MNIEYDKKCNKPKCHIKIKILIINRHYNKTMILKTEINITVIKNSTDFCIWCSFDVKFYTSGMDNQ